MKTRLVLTWATEFVLQNKVISSESIHPFVLLLQWYLWFVCHRNVQCHRASSKPSQEGRIHYSHHPVYITFEWGQLIVWCCFDCQQSNLIVIFFDSQEEEERHRVKLYAQLQSIGITALELVSGIKTLIAKESSLNAIKERLKLIHRYKWYVHIQLLICLCLP